MEQAIIEPAVLEKLKRVRKPKQFPPFYILQKNKGALEENFDVTNKFVYSREGSAAEGEMLIVCPYTKFIPLHYLFLGKMGYSYATKVLQKDVNSSEELYSRQLKKSKLLSGLLKHMVCCPGNINDVLNDYLFYDYSVGIFELTRAANRSSYLDESIHTFTGGYPSLLLRARSYSALLFPYTLYKRNEEGADIPEILAVILPENLIYQKLHIIHHGTIDMSKVIILVNRELDSTAYPNKAFRTSYKKNFEPLLKNIKADVWKVDQKWIIDNCFMQKLKIDDKNIVRRKEKIKELIQAFLNSAPKIEEDGIK